MHARAARIVDLHSVHAEVMARAIGMRRVNERQCDERPPVFRPARESGKTIETNVARDAIDDGPALHAARAHLEELTADVARVPELAWRRRQERLGEVDDTANQTERPFSERHLGAAGRAKEIRDQPEVRASDVREEQCGTARGNDTPVNLRRFEMRIDLRFDRDKVVVTAKSIEERAEILERVGQRSKGKGQKAKGKSQGKGSRIGLWQR